MFLNNIDGAQENESEIYTKCIYNVTLHLSHMISKLIWLFLRSAEADLRFSLHGGWLFHHHIFIHLSNSWDLWNFWKFDTEWSKLILFDLGKSFFL